MNAMKFYILFDDWPPSGIGDLAGHDAAADEFEIDINRLFAVVEKDRLSPPFN